jgi:hypothetical protein
MGNSKESTMRLLIQRKWRTGDTYEGELSIDGNFFCYTMERADGEHIPAGLYNVVMTFSPKFGRVMPLILVTGRDGIRFHSGSTYKDSEGCVLLGDKLISPEQIGGGLVDQIVAKFEKRLMGNSDIALLVTENWGD